MASIVKQENLNVDLNIYILYFVICLKCIFCFHFQKKCHLCHWFVTTNNKSKHKTASTTATQRQQTV